MSVVHVTRLKPNPRGKDRSGVFGATPAQLGAEWVDITNGGRTTVDLTGVELNHLAYTRGVPQPTWKPILTFKGSLGAGETVRVHSGQNREITVLNAEDRAGAEYHVFTGRDAYVWNNAEGDSAGLWNLSSKAWIDSASYDPYPPEGVVLVRSNGRLVPAGSVLRI